MKKDTKKTAAVKPLRIQATKAYAQFTILDANRAIDPKHVDKLKRSIEAEDLLHAYPIVCCAEKGKLVVLDGQHRLRAAEQLGWAIHYLVSPVMTPRHMAAVNNAPRSWRLKDYARYFGAENADYGAAVAFAEAHEINLSDAFNLLAHDGGLGGGGGPAAAWKRGTYKITSAEFAERVVGELAQWRAHTGPVAWKRCFLVALGRALATGLYDEKRMSAKRDQGCQPRERGDAKGYLKELADCYNFRTNSKVSFEGVGYDLVPAKAGA